MRDIETYRSRAEAHTERRHVMEKRGQVRAPTAPFHQVPTGLRGREPH